jgi:nucleotide-binding universal stress UspA family protein
MEEEKMSGIVCAIRGGPSSQLTIAQAVTLAQESSLPLHFLYVVNLDFLKRTISSRIHTISEQMQLMGESILFAAQAQAQEQGVTAQGIVRQGDVGEEIVALCHELKADYLVLGQPQTGGEEDNVFTRAMLQEFIERLEDQTGARVILTRGGSA